MENGARGDPAARALINTKHPSALAKGPQKYRLIISGENSGDPLAPHVTGVERDIDMQQRIEI